MKKSILLLIAIGITSLSYGQGEIDAFRSSRNDLQGTARVQAMGGAFGALGGDAGGVVINPAGIGIYRSSEITATLALSNVNVTTGASDEESRTKFNFDNLSYMAYYPVGDNSFNFGFTYNRLKNFDRNYSGYNSGRTTSLTDYMAYRAEGSYFENMNGSSAYFSRAPWLSILGWQGFLINDITDDTYESFLDKGERVDSWIESSERGRVEAYDFTVGTNISNNLLLGLTFSLTDIYYQMSSTYGEDFQNSGGFDLDNYLETTGSGYQLKLGAIYCPIDQLRLGVSYHSPTWYSLRDIYQASLFPIGISDDDGYLVPEVRTPNDAYYNYKFRTPYSWTFSLAYIMGTKAILSLDYELKDYAGMNLKNNNGYNMVDENDVINEDFQMASMIRVGLEYKFTPQFSGRLGYAKMGNPYADDVKNEKVQVMTSRTIPQYSIEGDVSMFTAGIGYRFTPQFYIDAAFVCRTQTDDFYYYSPMPGFGLTSQSVSSENKTFRGLVTLGYKF